MKNSILEKFFIGYVSFAILGLILITYWSTNITYNYLIEEYANDLYNYATLVSKDICDDVNDTLDEIKDYDNYVHNFNTVLDCDVWILGNEFDLLYSSDGSNISRDTSKSIIIPNFDPSDYSGRGHYRLNNFYNIFNTDVLNVAKSIKMDDDSVLGYVVVHMSTASIKTSSYKVTKVFYITYFVILLLSLLIFFNFIWFIYIPIKDIRLAAMEYAKGNFDYQKLTIYSDDELGDIASSLNYMTKQLKDNKEYQQKFISNISHDFRSPLTSIKGYIEAIMDGTIPVEDQNKYLSIVLAEATRLENLTTGLRDLNVWSNKGPELFLEEFDMLELLNTTIETLDGVSNKKHISLNLVNEAETTIVRADKSKIEQVAYNLIDNAIKFSFNNSEINIRMYNNRGKLYCTVKDTGIGISRDNVDKIWQRFYKADSSRGMDKTGSGIGLAIVKEIISAHNENIDVISTEGVGTEFIFSLSLASKNVTR